MSDAERAAETEQLTRDLARILLDRLREPDGFDAPEFDVVDQSVLIYALTLLAGGAAIIPPGWRIVPEEPTEKMWAAGWSTMFDLGETFADAYREMVRAAPDTSQAAAFAAAPTPPAAAEEKQS